jgi:hypothetical protein
MPLFGKKKEDMQGQDSGGQDFGYQQGYPGYTQDYGQYPPQDYGGQYPQQPPEEQASPGQGLDRTSTEEIAEAIVEEKWREKSVEISKVIEWKDEVTTKLAQLQQQIDDLKASFGSLHKGMLGKISEYDENLTNVGTEIKAMEKVFSRVLPSLTDSVNKLQRMSNNKK